MLILYSTRFVFFRQAQQHPNIKILRFDGPLYACNATFFKRKFYELIGIRITNTPLISFEKPGTIEIQENPIKYVILDCSPMNFIDTVGVKLLIDVSIIHLQTTLSYYNLYSLY